MIVWVVIEDMHYEGTDFIGVFDSPEAAVKGLHRRLSDYEIDIEESSDPNHFEVKAMIRLLTRRFDVTATEVEIQ